MTHTDAIRAQIDQLEDEVRKDPRVEAIRHLKAALAVLDGVSVVAIPAMKPEVMQRAPFQAEPKRAPLPGSIKKGSKISRINDLVGRHIDEHGPTHRAVLVQVLTDAGLNEGIKNPITAFSTSMHTLKDFYISDGLGTFRRRAGGQGDVSGGLQESPRGDAGGIAPPADSFTEQLDRKHVGENDMEAGGT